MSEAAVLEILATQYLGVAVLLLAGWAGAVLAGGPGRREGGRTAPGRRQEAARQAQQRRRQRAMVLIQIRRSR